MFGMFFLGTLYLERVLGYDAVEIGLAFLPVSLGIGILSLGLSARLGMRFGPRNVLVAGLVGIGAGLVLMTQVPVDGDYVANLLPAMVLLGAGAGLSFPAIMTLSMSDATPEDSGLLSGLVNTMQQVGAALGLAILATLATSRTDSLVADGAATPSALVDGYTLAFTVAAVLVAAAVVLSVVVLKSPKAAPAEAAETEPELVTAA
jgi:MFS family permease